MMGAMIKSAQCINLKEKKKQIKAILVRKECEIIIFFKGNYKEYYIAKRGLLTAKENKSLHL